MDPVEGLAIEQSRGIKSKELLLKDPEVVSFEFRRHSERNARPGMSGFLAETGPALAAQEAEKVTGEFNSIQGSKEVTLLSSPSWLPTREHGPINQPEVGQPLPADLKQRFLSLRDKGKLPEQLQNLKDEDFDNLSEEQMRLLYPINPAELAARPLSKLLLPRRAFFTAREYARKFFAANLLKNKPKSTINEKGETEMEDSIKQDKKLGDLFEYGNAEIPKFHQLLAKTRYKYVGGPNFWADFMDNRLDPEVSQLFKEVGGTSSAQLAENVLDVMTGTAEEKLKGRSSPETKELVTALTHGEVLESFIHHLDGFLTTTDDSTSADFSAKLKSGPNALFSEKENRLEFLVNKGFSAHLEPKKDGIGKVVGNELIVELSPEHRTVVDIDKFREYLERLKMNPTPVVNSN